MQNAPIKLDVPVAHPCYADHFPGDPLVPGALLLQWIEQCLLEVLPGAAIRQVKSAKFLGAVRPGDHCELNWQHRADKGAVSVDCVRAGEAVCRVQFIVDAG